MYNKVSIIFLIISTICINRAFAGNAAKIEVTSISMTAAKKLIVSERAKLMKFRVEASSIEPDRGQSFQLKTQERTLYIVSSTRSSSMDVPPTCSALLFNETKALISLIDTVGPNDDRRPWTCDNTKALSFSDNYPDGSLKIIVLYHATAPSSDRFIVPVVLKLSFIIPSLIIDEDLTNLFDDKEINSIKKARQIINHN
jgi:hypothetical protein